MSNRLESARRIFISYRRDDEVDFVQRIRDWFVQRFGRDNVFMDFDSIHAFADFEHELRERVQLSDVVIVIIGPKWLKLFQERLLQHDKQDYVRLEIELAIQQNKLVAPLCIKDALLPKPEDLPLAMRGMLRANAARIDTSHNFYDEITRIMDSIETELQRLESSNKLQIAMTNVHDSIEHFWNAFNSQDWTLARDWLNRISKFNDIPKVFNIEALEAEITENVANSAQQVLLLRQAEHEYEVIRRMVGSSNPNRQRIWTALQTFWQSYPDYDPDGLAKNFRQPLSEKIYLPFVNPETDSWVKGEGQFKSTNWQYNKLIVPIGLYDDVHKAQQLPVQVDLDSGNMAILGNIGAGKTTLLRTLFLSAVTRYSPEDLNVFVVDATGQLAFMQSFPHTAGYMLSDRDFDLLEKLNIFLIKEIGDRREKLLAGSYEDIFQHNANSAEKRLPFYMILIDNIVEVLNAEGKIYQDFKNDLETIARNGRSVGISLFITAYEVSELGRLTRWVNSILALRQTANNYGVFREIYATQVNEEIIPNIPGRALLNYYGIVVSMQCALPLEITSLEIDDKSSITNHLRRLGSEMTTQWGKQTIRQLQILPAFLPLTSLLDQVEGNPHTLYIGLTDSQLTPLAFDMLEGNPHLMITGKPTTGRTTVILTALLSLCWFTPPEAMDVFLLDYKSTISNKYPAIFNLPHINHNRSFDASSIDILYQEIKLRVENGMEVYLFVDDGDDFDSIDTYSSQKPKFEDLVRHYDNHLHIIVARSQRLPRRGDLQERIMSSSPILLLDVNTAQDYVQSQRLPIRFRNKQFVTGRAILQTKGEFLDLLQIAIPSNPQDISDTRYIETWVHLIQYRYPKFAELPELLESKTTIIRTLYDEIYETANTLVVDDPSNAIIDKPLLFESFLPGTNRLMSNMEFLQALIVRFADLLSEYQASQDNG